MDSVLDHLYAWLAHVRDNHCNIQYLQEATTVVHPHYLHSLGPAPLGTHATLLTDIRMALNTMIANLRTNMPYHQATNVGPTHGATLNPSPTWIVDPSLLLQIANNCLKCHRNAAYHRLPANMHLRLLQLHFELRAPVVPGQPAVKAPPMLNINKATTPTQHPSNPHAITKARPPPLTPTTHAQAPQPAPAAAPHPTMPWPAQYTPSPMPAATHPPAPNRNTQPLIKETTTTTTTTTRYYAADSEGGVDV